MWIAIISLYQSPRLLEYFTHDAEALRRVSGQRAVKKLLALHREFRTFGFLVTDANRYHWAIFVEVTRVTSLRFRVRCKGPRREDEISAGNARRVTGLTQSTVALKNQKQFGCESGNTFDLSAGSWCHVDDRTREQQARTLNQRRLVIP